MKTCYKVRFGNNLDPFKEGNEVLFDPVGKKFDVSRNGSSVIDGAKKLNQSSSFEWTATWTEADNAAWRFTIIQPPTIGTGKKDYIVGCMTALTNVGVEQRTGVFGAEG